MTLALLTLSMYMPHVFMGWEQTDFYVLADIFKLVLGFFFHKFIFLNSDKQP